MWNCRHQWVRLEEAFKSVNASFQKSIDEMSYQELLVFYYPEDIADLNSLDEILQWAIKSERYEIAQVITEIKQVSFN